jgi:hypothetical protein
VSPGRYDALRPGRFLADPRRPYGRIDIGTDDEAYLGDGWHASESAHGASFRWARQRASLFVPLDHVAPLEVEAQIMPFQPPGTNPQQVWIEVEGHTFGPVTLAGGWQRVVFATPAGVWSRGLSRLAFVAARETRPSESGGDTRPLAVAVDSLRVRVRSD